MEIFQPVTSLLTYEIFPSINDNAFLHKNFITN